MAAKRAVFGSPGCLGIGWLSIQGDRVKKLLCRMIYTEMRSLARPNPTSPGFASAQFHGKYPNHTTPPQ